MINFSTKRLINQHSVHLLISCWREANWAWSVLCVHKQRQPPPLMLVFNNCQASFPPHSPLSLKYCGLELMDITHRHEHLSQAGILYCCTLLLSSAGPSQTRAVLSSVTSAGGCSRDISRSVYSVVSPSVILRRCGSFNLSHLLRQRIRNRQITLGYIVLL